MGWPARTRCRPHPRGSVWGRPGHPRAPGTAPLPRASNAPATDTVVAPLTPCMPSDRRHPPTRGAGTKVPTARPSHDVSRAQPHQAGKIVLLHDATGSTRRKHGQMEGNEASAQREDRDQHWMAGYEGPWFSGLTCPTCGALVGNHEQYAVMHRRWHASLEAGAAH